MAVTNATIAQFLAPLGNNYTDPNRLVAVLVEVSGMQLVTVTGGGTLVAGDMALVTDGSAVLLPASPSNGNKIVVLSQFPGAPVTVNRNGSTINGVSGNVIVNQGATLFSYNGTTWVTG